MAASRSACVALLSVLTFSSPPPAPNTLRVVPSATPCALYSLRHPRPERSSSLFIFGRGTYRKSGSTEPGAIGRRRERLASLESDGERYVRRNGLKGRLRLMEEVDQLANAVVPCRCPTVRGSRMRVALMLLASKLEPAVITNGLRRAWSGQRRGQGRLRT